MALDTSEFYGLPPTTLSMLFKLLDRALTMSDEYNDLYSRLAGYGIFMSEQHGDWQQEVADNLIAVGRDGDADYWMDGCAGRWIPKPQLILEGGTLEQYFNALTGRDTEPIFGDARIWAVHLGEFTDEDLTLHTVHAAQTAIAGFCRRMMQLRICTTLSVAFCVDSRGRPEQPEGL